jgi:hypothetical protein
MMHNISTTLNIHLNNHLKWVVLKVNVVDAFNIISCKVII